MLNRGGEGDVTVEQRLERCALYAAKGPQAEKPRQPLGAEEESSSLLKASRRNQPSDSLTLAP